MESNGPDPAAVLEPALRARIEALMEDGRQLWDRFDIEVRQHDWHPFVATDFDLLLSALLAVRAPGLSFLEWGSGMGVVTIMADLLGFDACGIELDAALVETARGLAAKYDSRAHFAAGSFLPAGYEYRSSSGDRRTGTIGHGESGYLALRRPLEDFDLVYGYPWSGEEPVMLDVMRRYGRKDARLLLHTGSLGIHTYRDGRRVA
jgi:hypothetical protein